MSQQYQSYKLCLMHTMSACLGGVLFGYFLSVYNPLQAYFHLKFQWTKNQEIFYDGIITAIYCIGCTLGSLISSNVNLKFGRRGSMVISDVIAILAISLILIGPLYLLIIGRFIVGIVIGITSTSVPLYVNEINPNEIRGQMVKLKKGSHFQTAINIGILLSFIVGFGVPSEEKLQNTIETDNYWRIMFAISYIPCILRLLIFTIIFPYETPQYYYLNHQEDKMLEVLNKIYLLENIEKQQNCIKQKGEDNQDVTISDLFSKKYKNRLIVGLTLPIFIQFSGINSVVFYSNTIFISGGTQVAQLFSFIVGLFLLAGPFCSGFIIEKAGRQTYLLLGEVIMLVCLLLLVVIQNTYVDALMICIYGFAFGLSFGPIFWILAPEILPDRGVAYASTMNWLFTAIIGQAFPVLKHVLTLSGVFLLFSGFIILSIFFTKFVLKETQNKSPKQIIIDYGDDLDQNTEQSNEKLLAKGQELNEL